MRLAILSAAFFVGLGVSLPVSGQINDSGVFDHNLFSQKTIESHGEVLLTPKLNLDEGYLMAEKLAKSNAAKLFGEYYEVVREVDDQTGDIKEVVVSVNAAIMKYEVVSKSASTIDGNIVLRVDIKATADKKDLSAALNRYYENEQSKNNVRNMSEKVVELQDKLFEQELMIKRLMLDAKNASGLKSSVDIAELQANYTNQFKDYDYQLKSLKEALLFVDGSEIEGDYKEQKISGGREKYIQLLREKYAKTYLYISQTTKPSFLDKTQVTEIKVKLSGYEDGFDYLFKELVLRPVYRGLQSPRYSGYVEVSPSNPVSEVVYDYDLDLVVTINGVDVSLPIIKSYVNRNGYNPKGMYFNQQFNEPKHLHHRLISHKHKKSIDDFFDKMKFSSPLGQDISVYYRLVLTELSTGKVIDIKTTKGAV
ncbi:hypothetical protein [Pseudoalteromonas marina]|uniref:Uncharacterized protein n=1 Tax=Pseudoalteromonas marina TaxID=267375 RepID=A0ABT9FG97_9GAMM|nr:hypothetical protein [Pseudoalteromonas marina]MDP2565813.1 hypothetical protein [Pseudoalteromonas marina]